MIGRTGGGRDIAVNAAPRFIVRRYWFFEKRLPWSTPGSGAHQGAGFTGRVKLLLIDPKVVEPERISNGYHIL